MKKEIEESKRNIEKTVDTIVKMEQEFLDKNIFEYLYTTFIKTMRKRIHFCEDLIKEYQTQEAFDKVKEILDENIVLQKKWLDFIKTKKLEMKI